MSGPRWPDGGCSVIVKAEPGRDLPVYLEVWQRTKPTVGASSGRQGNRLEGLGGLEA